VSQGDDRRQGRLHRRRSHGFAHILGQAGPAAFVFAAAILGGIAVFGSNKTTRDQVISAIKVHEARRAEMINRLDLREVEGK
jgi:hypothetical protein